jgi:hypothetical protein
MPTAPEPLKRMAIICVVAFVVANVAFYFMSASYFDSHRQVVPGLGSMPSYSPAEMSHVRTMFAVFTGVVAAFGFAASLRGRLVGHVLPVLFGVAHLVGCVAAFIGNAPAVLGMTLLVSGILLPVLAASSYRGSRPAWAFLVAMCGVFAVVEFFGAPKVRGALGLSLWITMIFPGLNAIAVAALVSLRGEYVERDAAVATAH